MHQQCVGLFDLGFSWVEIGSVTPKPQASVSCMIYLTVTAR